jgi:hypothetical protein
LLSGCIPHCTLTATTTTTTTVADRISLVPSTDASTAATNRRSLVATPRIVIVHARNATSRLSFILHRSHPVKLFPP